MYKKIAILSISLLLLTSCNSPKPYGYVRIIFEHRWGNSMAYMDETTPYTNAAGNVLTLHNLEYFISDLTVGNVAMPSAKYGNIHYIRPDSALSTLFLTHEIPVGHYNHIAFTFGLDNTKNKSNLFPNSPEKDMFWPDKMGGGYHFMKFDGKWKNPDEPTNQGFGLHLGTLKKTIEIEGKKIDTLFPNYFHVSLPKNFEVNAYETTTIYVIVDLKQWMENPYTWDFNVMGGEMMSREQALDSLAQNGRNVFR